MLNALAGYSPGSAATACALIMAYFLRSSPHDTNAFSFVGLRIMHRVHRRAHLDLDALRHCVATVASDLRSGFDRSRGKLHQVLVLLEDEHEALDEVRCTISLLADDPEVVFGTSTDHDC